MGGRILYIEAPDGISGDMALGALIDLGVDAGQVTEELEKIIPGGFSLEARPFERNGIHGVNLYVHTAGNGDDPHTNDENEPSNVIAGSAARTAGIESDYHSVIASEAKQSTISGGDSPVTAIITKHTEHGHRHYSDIKKMIEGSGITERAKRLAIAVFDVIAEAEAAVHQVPKDKVAFHEVGALDSIIDIAGVAIAVDKLGVTDFYCSAPRDGSGTITCQHGLIPVPVPAVMKMAESAGIPIVIEADVHTEMITPTGFGIIKGLGAKFEPRLGYIPEKTGYGFGKRDTGRLGAVRITIGEKYEEEN